MLTRANDVALCRFDEDVWGTRIVASRAGEEAVVTFRLLPDEECGFGYPYVSMMVEGAGFLLPADTLMEVAALLQFRAWKQRHEETTS